MKIHSKKLRNSARGQQCTMRIPGICCNDPGTTVLAHAPFGGRGMATKASDLHALYCCRSCHDALDGRYNVANEIVAREELWECVIRGLAETHDIMVDLGLVQAKGVA